MGAAFQKQVTPAQPRLRLGFVVALLVVIAAGVAVLLFRMQTPAERPSPPASVHCTPLDAELRVRELASPIDKVTCLAIAGKIDEARTHLFAMPTEQRSTAIQRVFNIAHPIADRGDDKSAGPIMALVVEFWPENYMAVFHAGMAAFAQGQEAQAKSQLERFLTMYQPNDIWRARAKKALDDIAANVPIEKREAHFPE
jgi:hypothetical protein